MSANMERFVLQQSTQQGWWVCTDTVNNIVCKFKEHDFNNTSKFTFLDDVEHPDALAIARIMREFGDWLGKNHSDKIF